MLCVLRLVKAWPHDWLLHPFWSSAGPAEGPTGRQFGSKVVEVGLKDRSTASGENGHLAKTMLFIRFSYCLGGPWQALGSSGVPVEASQ